MNEVILKGVSASPGISIGHAHLWKKEEIVVLKRAVPDSKLAEEIARFEDALIKTRQEIIHMQNRISKDMGTEHAEIFDAHLLVLEDRMLIEEVITRIKKQKLTAAFIFSEVLKKYVGVFSRIEDEYLKERITDINDVGKRILKNLIGKVEHPEKSLDQKAIIVAHDLSPSETVSMHRGNVLGFITDIGGKTSHTAIMAKSLGIPAVVALKEATAKINNGDVLIVDGIAGKVIINPSPKTKEKYLKEKERSELVTKGFLSSKELPAQTRDGRRVEVTANLELPTEIPYALQSGAEGIGLYRTEFFYMNRKDLPSEEEHYQAYKKVAEDMRPHSVVIRTLDLGGDKFLSQLKIPQDMSPFLGWRAIRFCLACPDIFKTQLRAILRASVCGKLKLMYPMISGVEELRQANKLLEECKNELKKEKKSFDSNIEIGAMIEVPSAALTCDILAKEVDFFSIGTNDLIQYALAIDRTNEKIAYLYEPAHPAVLRLIKRIVDTGHQENTRVSMCGEMAGEPVFTLLLLGLELDGLSMPSMVIPQIKEIIRSISLTDAKKVVDEVFKFSTGSEVEEFTKKKLKELANIDL